MIEISEAIKLINKLFVDFDRNAIGGAMGEIANPDGTLANAKFYAGQSAGARLMSETIIAHLNALREDPK